MYGLCVFGLFINNVKSFCLDLLVTVQYLYVYWVDHLYVSGWKDVFWDHSRVHTFLIEMYLYWFEAFSLVVGMLDGVLTIGKLESFLVNTSGIKSGVFLIYI